MKRGLKRLKFQKKRAGIGQRGLEVWTPPPKPQNFTPPPKKNGNTYAAIPPSVDIFYVLNVDKFGKF